WPRRHCSRAAGAVRPPPSRAVPASAPAPPLLSSRGREGAPRHRGRRRDAPRPTPGEPVTSGSWKALIGLLVLTMGTSILTPLLPLYMEEYDLSAGTGTLLFVVYTITVAPTMLIAGNLSDRLGRKQLLLPA